MVIRDAPDSVRAYYNSCRHRGTRLVEGRGRVGTFICPFHGWRWNLDGSIKLILDQEEFDPVTTDNWSLVSVRCDTWGGFVFINMDPTAEPLLDYLSPVPRVFRAVPVREHAGDVVEEPAGAVQLEDRP